MQQPTDIQLTAALATAFALLGSAFFFGFLRSRAQRGRQVAALVQTPEQVLALRREGPDGDGYVRLYARLTTGKEVWVADHTELDAVERKLSAAMATVRR